MSIPCLSTMRLPASLLVLALAVPFVARGAAGEGAQGAPASDKAPLTFYFRALAGGQPVLDLKPGDVTVKAGGVARTIRSLDLLQFAGGADAPAPAPKTGLIPPPFASNQGAAGVSGRDVLLVIDDQSISADGIAPLQQALTSVLAAVSPRDRVGLLSVRPGGVNIGLTMRHADITAAVAALTGQRGSGDPCRATANAETLKNLVEGQQGASPATILFFSSGISGAGDSGVSCAIRNEDLRAFGASVQRANVNLFIVQVMDEMTRSLSSWLEDVAGSIDAETLRVTRSNPASIARVITETSSAYRVTVDRASGDRPGATARLELRVARPGTKVYAPQALTIPAEATSGAGANPAGLLRTKAAYADLPLRAAAYTSKNAGSDTLKVLAVFESADPSVPLTAASIGLFDSSNQSAARWTGRKSDFGRAPVLAAFPIAAGNYRMRVAAADGSGRTGAVDVDVTAGLTKAGPLALSAMVLGVTPPGGFVPKLQFSGEAEAVAYFEVYGVTNTTTPSVRMELAATEDGPALATLQPKYQRSAADGAVLVTATIPIASLPPGDVLVRAIVTLSGSPDARIVRTLRKVTP